MVSQAVESAPPPADRVSIAFATAESTTTVGWSSRIQTSMGTVTSPRVEWSDAERGSHSAPNMAWPHASRKGSATSRSDIPPCPHPFTFPKAEIQTPFPQILDPNSLALFSQLNLCCSFQPFKPCFAVPTLRLSPAAGAGAQHVWRRWFRLNVLMLIMVPRVRLCHLCINLHGGGGSEDWRTCHLTRAHPRAARVSYIGTHGPLLLDEVLVVTCALCAPEVCTVHMIESAMIVSAMIDSALLNQQ